MTTVLKASGKREHEVVRREVVLTCRCGTTIRGSGDSLDEAWRRHLADSLLAGLHSSLSEAVRPPEGERP